ncbi:hypothetical protein SFRURICE_012781 [Spodoptera frugiperda]|nr:hypothetical protein SFRURICE_012781 [Spodoptera frugiperda]
MVLCNATPYFCPSTCANKLKRFAENARLHLHNRNKRFEFRRVMERIPKNVGVMQVQNFELREPSQHLLKTLRGGAKHMSNVLSCVCFCVAHLLRQHLIKGGRVVLDTAYCKYIYKQNNN